MIKKRTFILTLEDDFYRYHFQGKVMTWLAFCASKIKTIFNLDAPSLKLTVSRMPFKGSRRVTFVQRNDEGNRHGLRSDDFNELVTSYCGFAIRDELGGGTYFYTLEAV